MMPVRRIVVPMSYSRIALAALGGTVAYFLLGSIIFVLVPAMKREFQKYSALHRAEDDMKRVMPIALLSTYVAIFVMTVLFAMAYPAAHTTANGAWFGALIGVFAVCGFAVHNYVTLNIGFRLTAMEAAGYFIEWVAAGVVVALIY
jgi:hypothetical protein